MRPRPVLLWLALAGACDRGAPTKPDPNALPPEVAKRFDQEGKPFRGIVIGPDAVYFDRRRTTDLRHDLDKAGRADPHAKLEAIVLPTAPVPTVTQTLMTVKASGWERFDVRDHEAHLLCDLNWQDPPDSPQVMLSIEVRIGQVIVGISHINEFSIIANAGNAIDREKLETTLKESRTSELFSGSAAGSLEERRDAQLAVAPQITTAVFLDVLSMTCGAGLNAVDFVAPDKLAAHCSGCP